MFGMTVMQWLFSYFIFQIRGELLLTDTDMLCEGRCGYNVSYISDPQFLAIVFVLNRE